MYYIREYIIDHPTGFLLIRLKESSQYHLPQLNIVNALPYFFQSIFLLFSLQQFLI